MDDIFEKARTRKAEREREKLDKHTVLSPREQAQIMRLAAKTAAKKEKENARIRRQAAQKIVRLAIMKDKARAKIKMRALIKRVKELTDTPLSLFTGDIAKAQRLFNRAEKDRKLKEGGRHDQRRREILRRRAQGHRLSDIAKYLGMSEDGVYYIVRKYGPAYGLVRKYKRRGKQPTT